MNAVDAFCDTVGVQVDSPRSVTSHKRQKKKNPPKRVLYPQFTELLYVTDRALSIRYMLNVSRNGIHVNGKF